MSAQDPLGDRLPALGRLLPRCAENDDGSPRRSVPGDQARSHGRRGNGLLRAKLIHTAPATAGPRNWSPRRNGECSRQRWDTVSRLPLMASVTVPIPGKGFNLSRPGTEGSNLVRSSEESGANRVAAPAVSRNWEIERCRIQAAGAIEALAAEPWRRARRTRRR
jgi:hypothetical protein